MDSDPLHNNLTNFGRWVVQRRFRKLAVIVVQVNMRTEPITELKKKRFVLESTLNPNNWLQVDFRKRSYASKKSTAKYIAD
jgi:hypothetical protein